MKDSLMWVLFVCVMEISGRLILKNICSYIVCSKRLFYLFVNKIFFFVIEHVHQIVAIGS